MLTHSIKLYCRSNRFEIIICDLQGALEWFQSADHERYLDEKIQRHKYSYQRRLADSQPTTSHFRVACRDHFAMHHHWYLKLVKIKIRNKFP